MHILPYLAYLVLQQATAKSNSIATKQRHTTKTTSAYWQKHDLLSDWQGKAMNGLGSYENIQQHGFCLVPTTTKTWLLFSSNINNMAVVLFWLLLCFNVNNITAKTAYRYGGLLVGWLHVVARGRFFKKVFPKPHQSCNFPGVRARRSSTPIAAS